MPRFDPYEILGVPRNADADAIKKAHRARAKQTHPDCGGEEEEFKDVCRAVAVLKDPKKRAQFDRDGTLDDGSPNNEMAQACSLIAAFILAKVNQLGETVLTQDLLGQAQDAFGLVIKGHEAAIQMGQRKVKALEKTLQRLKSKDGKKSFVHTALQNAIDGHHEHFVEPRRQIAAHKAAIEMLKTLEFKPDRPDGQAFALDALFHQQFRPQGRGW